MEEERICTHCGEVMAEDEGTVVDEELLCDECVDDYCITCDCCGETIWTEDCVTDDNTYLVYSFVKNAFPVHFIHVIIKCHRMGNDFKTVVQTAVRLDVDMFMPLRLLR